MKLVDSSGWLEFFSDGPLAGAYAEHLADLSQVVTPTVVLYEVYRKIKRERTEEEALIAAAQIPRTRLIPPGRHDRADGSGRGNRTRSRHGRCHRFRHGTHTKGRANHKRCRFRKATRRHLLAQTSPSLREIRGNWRRNPIWPAESVPGRREQSRQNRVPSPILKDTFPIPISVEPQTGPRGTQPACRAWTESRDRGSRSPVPLPQMR